MTPCESMQSYILVPRAQRRPFPAVITCTLIFHCAFFEASCPVSLSKAAYDTCKLASAETPTYAIESKRKPTTNPMKSPSMSVSDQLRTFTPEGTGRLPGVKNWYLSKSGPSTSVSLFALLFRPRLRSLLRSICIASCISLSIS